MTVDECIEKISRYFESKNAMPLLVDVQNLEDMNKLKEYFGVDAFEFVSASQFCREDALPRIEVLLSEIAQKNKKIFVTELTVFLKLLGDEEVKQQLDDIMHMSIRGHVVILSYQCKKLLGFHDTRLLRNICIIDGKTDSIPEIIFVSKDFVVSGDEYKVNGIQSIGKEIGCKKIEKLYVCTSKSKEVYRNSAYQIKEMKNAYSAIMHKDSTIAQLGEELGNDIQWEYLLSLFEDENFFVDIINKQFGNYQALGVLFFNYTWFDDSKKWLYYIALKLFGEKNNWCLSYAARESTTIADFTKMIYRSILQVEHTNVNFDVYYNDRKSLLNMLGNPTEEVVDFCKMVYEKEKNAIYYLTDNTVQEKELIIILLDQYGSSFEKDELKSALKRVYTDISDYLEPSFCKNEFLDKYFSLYKYSKVINKILPELDQMMTQQSTERAFNFWLEPRYTKLEQIDMSDSEAYFVDAMGIEHVSFILAKCRAKGLIANTTICRSNLPTITSCNKEFIEEFTKRNIHLSSIKELDTLKHHGTNQYDYQQTKTPIHLIKELEIFQHLIENVYSDIVNGKYTKAIIISDHGASRLAVLNESENMYEMASKGKHSGRCCPKSEADVRSEFAVEADGFWVLANYDRFKGGRKACVEVHGGATLEEVVVPIIEITKLPTDIEIKINEQSREVFVSFRKNASLTLFSKTKLENVSVRVEGMVFDAKPLDEHNLLVEMPQIKKPKKYSMDVYVADSLVVEGLEFIVKKEGSQEKDIL